MKKLLLIIFLLFLPLFVSASDPGSAPRAISAGPTIMTVSDIAPSCPEGETRCDDGTCQELCPLKPAPEALPELPNFCDDFTCDDGRCVDREVDCQCSKELPYFCDGECLGTRECADPTGTGVSDDTETTGIEHEDIGITGAAGEPDDDNDGTMDELDIPPGADQKQKEAREIVVVGSEVRDGDPHKEWIDILSATVATEEDLEEFAIAMAESDENIEEIGLYYNKIDFSYKQPAKLFGFIPMSYTARAQLEQGKIKVRFPWFLAFTSDNAKELEEELEALEGDAETLTGQQQALRAMSNAMKTGHDTTKAIINNVR